MDTKTSWTTLLGLLHTVCKNPGQHVTICMSTTQYLKHKNLLSTSINVPVTSVFARPNSMQFKLAKPEKLLPVGSLAKAKLTFLDDTLIQVDEFMYICRIKVGNHKLIAMIDTGATYAVMDYDKAMELFFCMHDTSPVSHLETANKEPVLIEGSLKENISIGNYTSYTQQILLMKGLTSGVDIILGQDFLLRNRVWVGEGQMLIKHRKGDYHFPPDFFTLNSPTSPTKHKLMSCNALLKHMQKHGKLCLAWIKRDQNGVLQVNAGPFREKENFPPPPPLPPKPPDPKTKLRYVPKTQLPPPPPKPPNFVMGKALLPKGHKDFKKYIPPPKTPVPDQDPNKRVIDDFDFGTLDEGIKLTLQKHWSVFQPLTPGVQDKYEYDGEVIPLSENSTPFRKMYRLSPAEQAEATAQIEEFLRQGWIQESKSPFGAPILLAAKKGGALRLCVDYRKLNAITVKNRFPLPNIQDCIDMLEGAKYFTSLDLIAGYHQIKLKTTDVPKTAFRTPTGHYECLVLWEGLTNAPSAFQSIMHRILKPFLGKFCALYIDDIIIFSKTIHEHASHLDKVLGALKANNLKAKLAKCDFAKPTLQFLGHIISHEGVSMDPGKTKILLDWPELTKYEEIRSFCGLANYFARFIDNYHNIAHPLTKLQNYSGRIPETGEKSYGDEQREAFKLIKLAVTSAPVLKLPDMVAAANGKAPFHVQVDASDDGMGGVLLQDDRPVAYFSKQFSTAERKFIVSDREMCAIVFALKQWRCYIEGPEFVLHTDHEPLTYFENISTLDRRKAAYVEFLSRFNYQCKHIPGKTNVVADFLSRNPKWTKDNAPTLPSMPPDDELHAFCNVFTRRGAGTTNDSKLVHKRHNPNRRTPPSETISQMQTDPFTGQAPPIAQPQTPAQAAKTKTPEPDAYFDEPDEMAPLLKLILLGYLQDKRFSDPQFTKKYTHTKSGFWLIPGTPRVLPDKLTKLDYSNPEFNFCQIVVPNVAAVKQAVIEACHDTPYSGHRGKVATKDLVAKDFYWHGLDLDVAQYVKTCDTCQKTKTSTLACPGKLQNLSIPMRRGSHYSLDQIVCLPLTKKGYDAILVVIDRLTKYVHYLPCKTSDTAEQLALIFFQRVLVHWGIPDDIVSDRDDRFSCGNFIKEVWRLFGVHQSPSTSYRPQSDGQTERMNRVFHEYIRAYISETHTNWDTHLYTAQFAVNNSISEATGCTPAFLTFGFHPKTPHSAQISKALGDSVNIRSQAGYEFAKTMHDNIIVAQRCLQRAQDKMKAAYDKHKRDLFFEVGEMVLLKTTHITMAGKRKFLPKYLGPLEVLKTIGPGPSAYQLKLPESWRIHNVFNVSLLKPYFARTLVAGNFIIPDILDDYSVVAQSITGHKLVYTNSTRKKQNIMYKVHFQDTTCENDTWEYLKNIPKNYHHLVQHYHATNSHSKLPPFAATNFTPIKL